MGGEQPNQHAREGYERRTSNASGSRNSWPEAGDACCPEEEEPRHDSPAQPRPAPNTPYERPV